MADNPQCAEHQRRMDAFDRRLETGDEKFLDLNSAIHKLEEVKATAERTEQRTVAFIASFKRIEIALAGDPDLGVDGLAKEHKRLKAEVAAMKDKDLVRSGWAAGAGAVGAGVLMFLKFLWSMISVKG